MRQWFLVPLRSAQCRWEPLGHPMCIPQRIPIGRSPERPFSPKTIHTRARRAWVDLEPLTLHECRHTYASLMIAAGVNAKALSTYMGHASVVITYDLYGHLMPGNEAEAAQLLDALLDRA
ncbi:MAG TPA: site-specific integrase [Solirubrobacteraceae bacterium]|nr:site-specific integrase [Solirubrobacteraceae bacterium]